MSEPSAAVPESMRAWRVVRHGEPIDVMELHDVAVPVPGVDEVLVRVRSVAANFPDVLLARGEYQVRPELPFSPGIELSGEIVAFGPGTDAPGSGDGPGIGDRVVATKIGVLSEYAVLAASDVHAVPGSLDDEQAAGLMIAYQTAWFALHRRARLEAGEVVLVHAAAGGVGSATVQLAVAAGARVIGVVGSAEKVEVVRAAGAELVIVRGDEDFAARVNEATGGHGADVVVDPVGGESFERSTKCIAFEGRIVVVGFAGGTVPTVRANHALVKNYGVLGLHWGLYPVQDPALVAEAHADLVRLADAGAIAPLIGGVVEFEDAPRAIQELAGGKTVGRLVIRVA